MELLTWITYVGVIVALIIFPGPVALLCTSHGLRFGRRRASATVVGGTLASLALMLLSALGLGAVLATSESTFHLLKLIGGAYLVVLGLQAWRRAGDVSPLDAPNSTAAPRPANTSSVRLFRQGFLVGIGNPKDLLFFAALFPNFIDVSEPQLLQFTILAATWLVIDLTLMSLYAAMGSGLGQWFRHPRRARCFHRATGGLFMTAGGSLIASSP
ncbi:LysE family translocator [Halomonas organivorans]|uniref:Threonine/homoserine/homoserine lactone efflux protein n=1 Tax=Halomonas organivorans TaxID=257772 RepID=A0A7W5BXQ3_9GAMM|nr:LysE family transporter [Halomonas organivorans]MBB3140128.1 threonine/homoserine/homoserine lactone efflux protein [Halomonas organivorans]